MKRVGRGSVLNFGFWLNLAVQPKKRSMKALFSLFLLAGVLAAQAQIRPTSLKIDTTITGFHFAGDNGGTFTYMPNGRADLAAWNPSSFAITLLPNATARSAQQQLDALLEMSKQNGYTQADIVRKDTTVNGNPAAYLSYTETLKGSKNYKNQAFHAFYLQGRMAVLFFSSDQANGQHLDNLKKTFFSLK